MMENTETMTCDRRKCQMSPEACVRRQQRAFRVRKAIRSGKGSFFGVVNDVDYGIMLVCLCCKQGALVRKAMGARLKVQGAKGAGQRAKGKTGKPIVKKKSVPRARIKPRPPVHVAAEVWDKPLCKVCGQWTAICKGMCRACYRRDRRGRP